MNICFDLETLGNKPDAPITQIGAVKFDIKDGITSQFLINIDFEHYKNFNFNINYDTLKFWFSQKKSTITKVMLSKNSHSPLKAINEFFNWVCFNENRGHDIIANTNDMLNDYTYWSHTFDPVVFRYTYNELTKNDIPISYRNFCDLRTLTYLTKDKVKKVKPNIEHDALEDAKAEALYIIRCLKYLKKDK